MKRLAFLLTCAIATQMGCGGDGDENEVRPVSDYFPLAVGTTWVYDVGSGTGDTAQEETRTTTGLSSRAGVAWYRISIAAADGSTQEIEVAVTDGSLVRRAPGGGDETVLLREPVIPGTQWLNELPEVPAADDTPTDGTADGTADGTEAPAETVAAAPAQDGETPDEDPNDPDADTVDEDSHADGEVSALYEILSASDVVVTPLATYTDVVTVRGLTQGVDVVFYQFAPEIGLVRSITEPVTTDAPDAPTGGADASILQLQEFSDEPIVAEETEDDTTTAP
ncbi:hypothetical protein HN371_13860 [Candidatus Poribacteria bacterium]|jgi:hypothetical protein|nr:hypothetical protein [Candidatus Poribacteria bacterium]MBT5531826.1 hypothetical protein [Candidatus Poribacteria bacterium]MBT5713099.1 hypothetical protein [Candidatus Poribacteria bacterium]MBT7098812.1 hypothetical protein [Candidatus Poribacteria bacterium]MBT7804653.1 hypothetical protein [Candidatus Poribacteria bacterium]